MVIEIWVPMGSDNGFLPGDTKPLPESVSASSVKSSDIHLRVFTQSSINKIGLNLLSNFHPNISGVIELMYF